MTKNTLFENSLHVDLSLNPAGGSRMSDSGPEPFLPAFSPGMNGLAGVMAALAESRETPAFRSPRPPTDRGCGQTTARRRAAGAPL
jgi:hypothetical protein